MNRPVLLIRLGRGEGPGRLDCSPDLATAATAAAIGPRARVVTAGPAGTVPEWAATLARSRPSAMVLVEDRSTRVAGEHFGAELAALGVAVSRAEPEADRWRLAHRGGPHADLTSLSAPDRVYRSGAVPAALAAVLGVPAGEGTREELRHLAAVAAAPMTVPLIGGPETDWIELAELLRRDRAEAGGLGIALRPRVRAELVEGDVAEAVAALADDGVTVECDPVRTSPERLRSALSAFGAHRIAPRVRVRAAAAGARRADRLAGLLRVVPDAEVATDAASLRGLAARGGLAGCPPQTRAAVRLRADRRQLWAGLARASGGRYGRLPVTAGAHDLWWDHAEPVEAHTAWLGAVVSAGGTVWARRPGTASAAHVAVRDLDAVAAAGRYGDTAAARPSLVWIDSAEAVLADADEAWHRGRLSERLFDPSRFIAGLCRLGHGSCPAASGRQMYVAPDGAVRAGRAGPAVGEVGDDLPALRAAIRALPASEDGCRCRPEGMAPAGRPWLGRVLSAAAAVADLGGEHRELFEPSARKGMRASGCGGPLTHAHGSAADWPAGTALLRHGDRHYLRTPERIHRLTPSLAAVVELRLDRPRDAAGLLARSHRLSAAESARVLAAAESALASARVPATREVSA